ncbi:unnamed protein product, partial [Staurois parvus]
AVDGRGRARAQAGAGDSKVSIIGVSGRDSAPSFCHYNDGALSLVYMSVVMNSVPSLVSERGIMPTSWCQSEELCPIIGVRATNRRPSLVSVEGIARPIIGVSGKNRARDHWCQCGEEQHPIIGVSGRIAPH